MAYLKVRVSPGARNDSISGWQDDALRVTVRAAPERGRANEAVCRLLARALGLPANHVTVARGMTSRTKLLAIDALSDDEVRAKLGAST